MKTERRHELKENDLIHLIQKITQSSGSNGRVGLIVIVAVCAIWGIYSVWSSSRTASLEESWEQFLVAAALPDSTNVSDQAQAGAGLRAVGAAYKGTVAGAWALQFAADRQLALGNRRSYQDPEQAKPILDAARDTYERVLKQAKQTKQPMLTRRALFGLAQTEETLGNVDEAKVHYENIKDTWPESAVGKAAKVRYEDLEKKSTKDFYAWYMTAERRQSLLDLGDSAGRFGLPQSNLPTGPDFGFPSVEGPSVSPDPGIGDLDFGGANTETPDAGESVDVSAGPGFPDIDVLDTSTDEQPAATEADLSTDVEPEEPATDDAPENADPVADEPTEETGADTADDTTADE